MADDGFVTFSKKVSIKLLIAVSSYFPSIVLKLVEYKSLDEKPGKKTKVMTDAKQSQESKGPLFIVQCTHVEFCSNFKKEFTLPFKTPHQVFTLHLLFITFNLT